MQSLRGLSKPQRQSQKPNSSKQVLRLKIAFDSAKTGLLRGGGDISSPTPQERASSTLEKAGEDSHRGPEQERRAKGGGGCRAVPCQSPFSPLSMYRNEKQKQEESMLLEAGRGLGMAGRGSLSTVPSNSSFYVEPTDPITELERGGGGGGHGLALACI